MAYTEVSHESWFGRIGSSIKGVLVGGLFIVVAIVALFWNEGRAVRQARTLAEGRGAVIAIDSAKLDPANEGKLVHLTGETVVSGTLADPEFGIEQPAIKLQRTAEMYQWREEKETKREKKLGGGTERRTTYEYKKVWREGLIDSSEFKQAGEHRNPTQMPVSSRQVTATDVTLGAFLLPNVIIDDIDNETPLPVEPSDLQRVDPKWREKLKPYAGGYYLGADPAHADPANPQIGDVRVKFSVVEPGPLSVIAQQTGGTLRRYQTRNDALHLVAVGNVSADQMFADAEHANTVLTWLVRGGGFLAMTIGLAVMLNPLKVLADVVPLLGSIAGTGIFLVSAVVSGVISLLVIATAWLFYRPLLAVTLIALAAGLVWWLRGRRGRTPAPAAARSPVPPIPPPPPIPQA